MNLKYIVDKSPETIPKARLKILSALVNIHLEDRVGDKDFRE